MAITGPESTGKSELARSLAEHFNTSWVPEFSRGYLSSLGRNYQYGDILEIARGQYAAEQDRIHEANEVIFIDTEFIVNKIWCEDKFGQCHSWINEMIGRHVYELYLLCNTDIPWTPDPLRENPDDRERLFQMYLQELNKRQLSYHIIEGSGAGRTNMAIQIVENGLNAFRKGM